METYIRLCSSICAYKKREREREDAFENVCKFSICQAMNETLNFLLRESRGMGGGWSIERALGA